LETLFVLLGRNPPRHPNPRRRAAAVARHNPADHGTPPWWNLVNPSTPLGAEDVARLAADIDTDDVDDADWVRHRPGPCSVAALGHDRPSRTRRVDDRSWFRVAVETPVAETEGQGGT
jgi:hypothetical protein